MTTAFTETDSRLWMYQSEETSSIFSKGKLSTCLAPNLIHLKIGTCSTIIGWTLFDTILLSCPPPPGINSGKDLISSEAGTPKLPVPAIWIISACTHGDAQLKSRGCQSDSTWNKKLMHSIKYTFPPYEFTKSVSSAVLSDCCMPKWLYT